MPNCSSSRSAICQHLPGDRTVQSHRFYTSRPTVTLCYSDIKVVTSTSVSHVVEQESFPPRSTAVLHFHTYYLSLLHRRARTPLNNRCVMQTPRDIDTASNIA